MPSYFQVMLIALVIGVIFVNGWTDAPNAITCVVSTKSLSYKKAVSLAAFCNLAGILVMSLISSSVAETISFMVKLDNATRTEFVAVLCGAMLSIIVFSVAAWFFGIPTSESHGLIAGLSGAAAAFGGMNAVNFDMFKKVFWGLVISLVLSFVSGKFCSLMFGKKLMQMKEKTLDIFQIFSAALTAFMHGAQDGQKFIAIFVMADNIANYREYAGSIDVRNHGKILILCAVVMFLGTSTGGRRIVENIGEKMVKLEKYQGVCADISSSACLFLGSMTGIPMSTTHTKTIAILGACWERKKGKAHKGVVSGILTAWIVTFPICGVIGFWITKLLLSLT